MGGLVGLLAFYLLFSILTNRNQPKRNDATAVHAVAQETSWRLIFLTLFLIIAYVLLAAWLSVTLAPVLASVRIEWLRKSLEFAGLVLFPLVVLRSVPPWLAWRVCRPAKLFLLGRFCYWFTPGAGKRELEQFAALLDAMRGVPPAPPPAGKNGLKEKILRFLLLKKPPRLFSVDAGTVVALALAAEIRGDFGRAERLLHAFALGPPEATVPRMLRRFAFEELAWHSAQRGAWQSVLDRARRGCGRGMPLLKLLARERLTGRVNRLVLVLAWSIFPARWRALPFVWSAMRGSGAPPPKPDSPAPVASLRLTHLRLLHQAAEGLPVAMVEVFRLAQRWDKEFTPDREEILLRRGMALGARDVLGMTGKIRESVLEELEELAATADGEIPEEIGAGVEGEERVCATQLAVRLRNRLYDEVARTQELCKLEENAQVSDAEILDLWERWLALHEAVTRFQRLLGTGELATLWHGGLRNAAWNGASRLSNACGNRIAWISIIQFYWVIQLAELLEDEEAMTVNRNNLKLCGYRPPSAPRRLLLGLSSRRHRFLDRLRGKR